MPLSLGGCGSLHGFASGGWAGFGPLPAPASTPRLGTVCTSVGVGLEWSPPRGRSQHPRWGVGGDISHVTCAILTLQVQSAKAMPVSAKATPVSAGHTDSVWISMNCPLS